MVDSSVGSVHSDGEPSQAAQQAHNFHNYTDNTTTLLGEGSQDDSNLVLDSVDKAQRAETPLLPSLDAESDPSPGIDGAEIPRSKWKNTNASEIDLTDSIHRLIAQDLSIHLYNAVKLKQRGLNQRMIERQGGTSSRNKDSPVITWTPPKSWTAWPMPLDIVPRDCASEKTSSLPSPYLIKPVKPSQILRELLLAQILRHAKYKLQKREFESFKQNFPRELPGTFQSSAAETSFETNMDPGQDSGASSSLEPKYHTNKTKSNINKARTASFIPLQVNALRPTMLLDDQYAESILQPSILDVLAKLDRLLINLHHSRKSYTSVNPKESVKNTNTELPSKSRSRSAKAKRKCSMTRRHSPIAVDDSMSTDDDFDDEDDQPRRKRRFSSQSNRLQLRKLKLGLRDWSDVLMIATLSGFKPAVIQRAKAQCESLFEKEMQFRESREADTINYRGLDSANNQDIHFQSPADEFVGGVHVDGFLQPIKAKRSWRVNSDKRK